MDYLLFLTRLKNNNLAINPALVLLYIDANPACQQKDMIEPLKMNRNVLSQCCTMLINKELIFQDGPYCAKQHYIRKKGEVILTNIKNDNT